MPTPISQDAKKSLQDKIQQCDTLSHEEKSTLYGLLSERKRYGLVWEDKPEQAYEQLRTQIPVFTEVPERRIMGSSADAPNHILIEGDNLHALTAMQYTHAGKVDVIYIDPPYNTGNKDFSYNDTFVDKEDQWRHSKWLSFMEKRLKLAKTLLKETGVIFISIDDNEQAQLRLVCDELFNSGRSQNDPNYLATLIWNLGTGTSAGHFTRSHEYVLAYAKEKSLLENFSGGEGLIDDRAIKKVSIKNPASDFSFPAGTEVDSETDFELFDNWGDNETTILVSGRFIVKDKKLVEPITLRAGWTQKSQMKAFFDGQDVFDSKGQKVLRFYFRENGKIYCQKQRERLNPPTVLDDVGSTKTGTTRLAEIFGESTFAFPKSQRLIEFLIGLSSKSDSLILDFFAGSGTTLHATMALNAEDGGKRQCILVTNNENEICEKVTYERNKRVIQGYTNSKGEQVPGLTDNSLRYYRTEFVTREISLRNRFELTRKTLDLLCVKEDCYTPRNDLSCQEFQVFEATAFMLFLVLNPDSIDDVIQVIASQTKRCKVYVHSPDADPFSMDFDEICDKIELHALPDSFHRALREFLPDTNTDSVETAENQDD